MNLRIDRELPVPFGVQLRGLIEYGIACGELAPGSRLPSVRELAALLGLAPMTVSQVYKELKASGLLEGRAGAGTCVAAINPGERPNRLTGGARGVDRLIAEARGMGVPPLELQRLFNTRLLAAAGSGRGSLRLTLVGLFPAATRDYARAIEARLRPGETVEPVTLDELRASEAARLRAGAAELVLTFAHIRADVVRLLPGADMGEGEDQLGRARAQPHTARPQLVEGHGLDRLTRLQPRLDRPRIVARGRRKQSSQFKRSEPRLLPAAASRRVLNSRCSSSGGAPITEPRQSGKSRYRAPPAAGSVARPD